MGIILSKSRKLHPKTPMQVSAAVWEDGDLIPMVGMEDSVVMEILAAMVVTEVVQAVGVDSAVDQLAERCAAAADVDEEEEAGAAGHTKCAKSC